MHKLSGEDLIAQNFGKENHADLIAVMQLSKTTLKAKFAVLIPAHNCAPTIQETISSLESIVDGWDAVHSVVVCDDCSKDDTVDVLGRLHFTKAPLHILQHAENLGEGRCYQTMLASLPDEVEWFLILHSDDLALGNFLVRNIFLAANSPERTAAVSSNYYVFGDNEVHLAHEPLSNDIVWRGGSSEDIFHTASIGTWWHISGSLVKRSVWEAFGGRRPDLPQLGDWDLMLRWQRQNFLIGHSLCPTTKYRVSPKSVSSRSYEEYRDLVERADVIRVHKELFAGSLRLRWAKDVGIQFIKRSLKHIASLSPLRLVQAIYLAPVCVCKILLPSRVKETTRKT